MKAKWYSSSEFKIELVKDVIFLLVGGGIGFGIDRLSSGSSYVLILVSILVFTALLNVLLFWTVTEVIMTRRRIESRSFSVTLGLGENAFDHCKSALRQVQRNVDVVGPYFGDPQMYMTKAHDDYLVEGVDAAIKRHQLDEVEGSIFSYFRLVQLPEKSCVEDSRVSVTQIGNDGLAKHLKDLLERQKTSTKISIDIRGMGVVPSFPSTLVIDNRYVFFSIPTTQQGDGQFHMDLVVGIEDQTGVFPSEMRKVIRHLRTMSREIAEVDGDFPRPEISGQSSGDQPAAPSAGAENVGRTSGDRLAR